MDKLILFLTYNFLPLTFWVGVAMVGFHFFGWIAVGITLVVAAFHSMS